MSPESLSRLCGRLTRFSVQAECCRSVACARTRMANGGPSRCQMHPTRFDLASFVDPAAARHHSSDQPTKLDHMNQLPGKHIHLLPYRASHEDADMSDSPLLHFNHRMHPFCPRCRATASDDFLSGWPRTHPAQATTGPTTRPVCTTCPTSKQRPGVSPSYCGPRPRENLLTSPFRAATA